jgi:hypothetical protein
LIKIKIKIKKMIPPPFPLCFAILVVPDVVWDSWFFWIALLVMVIGIPLYQNNFFNRRSILNRLFWKGDPNTATIHYSSDGRSGYVHYKSAEASFDMYYEFSGGNCVASIDIPSPETWKKHTGLPLSRRDEVLDFIGRQVVKDQTSGGKGYFKIEGNWLHIYV